MDTTSSWPSLVIGVASVMLTCVVAAPMLLLAVVQSGDSITFSWHFVGIGKEQCFHDGEELQECSSPLQVGRAEGRG